MPTGVPLGMWKPPKLQSRAALRGIEVTHDAGQDHAAIGGQLGGGGGDAGFGEFKKQPTPYDAFMESEGIPVFRDIGISSVANLPLHPWKRLGGKGHYIQLYGTETKWGSYVVEVPPGGALNAELLRDDLETKPPMRLADVEAAQKEILITARRMADAGEIMLGGGGDQMV